MTRPAGLSKFGKKFTEQTGIMDLMDDMARAMAEPGEKSMFGGGNPAIIDGVVDRYMQELQKIASDKEHFTRAFGNYDTPQGNQAFIVAIAAYLKRNLGWDISEKNIVVTPGSQTGFFELFNMLAGERANGSYKKILFPIVPEYVGYADQGVSEDIFVGSHPKIKKIDDHTFKYMVDFEALERFKDIAAVCISRPTNPTGNVIDETEVNQLREFATAHGVPLILDCAYGWPFPGVLKDKYVPEWDEGLIYAMSLSKVGLPGARSGIFVCSEEIATRLTHMNAILSLANANIGQLLVTNLIANDEINLLCEEYIQPFYAEREKFARSVIEREFDDSLPYKFHDYEGAYFYWLWLEDMPISSHKLYGRLKQRGVVVVPGEYFFPGIGEEWQHTRECLRLNYSRPQAEVERGFAIMAEEIKKAYA